MLAEPTMQQRRGPGRDPLFPEPRPAAHRHLGPASFRAGAGVLELPAPARRPGPGHRHLRPDPADAAADRHPLSGHPRRGGPGRPVHGHRHDGVRPPALHPCLGRGPASAPRDRHRPGHVRRRLPRVGLPRGRRQVRACRRRTTRRPMVEPSGGRPPSGCSSTPRSATCGAHRSAAPSPTPAACGWSTSTDLPDHGVLGRFEARDHLGDPRRSLQDNVEAFLAQHGVDLTGGRILMAANARAFGYCFNPISVHWCFDPRGRAGRRRRRGAQHLRRPARLSGPPRRAGPGPRRQADVCLAVPRRRRRLRSGRSAARASASTSR